MTLIIIFCGIGFEDYDIQNIIFCVRKHFNWPVTRQISSRQTEGETSSGGKILVRINVDETILIIQLITLLIYFATIRLVPKLVTGKSERGDDVNSIYYY